jgi:hypothetical protein
MSQAGSAAELSFDDRLIAECVRVIERDGREKLDEPSADEAGRANGDDFENRIITRARALTIAGELDGAIRQLRAGITWIIVIGLLIAFLLGAATARTTMAAADDTRVNFYWVLGGVLGVQSILLVIWLIAAAIWRVKLHSKARGSADSAMHISLGRLIVVIGQWLGAKLQSASAGRAVVYAAGGVFTTGRIGFWTFSSITHAIWLLLNVGALVLILLLLSAKQYTFVWETTILSERHYITMTEWLSEPAQLAGFAVPTDEDITQSQWRGHAVEPMLPDGASQRWASLLVASIVLYGFGPRVLLLGLSLSMRRRACRAYRLDTALPGYERLRATLMPQSQVIGVVDPDDGIGHDSQSPGIPIPEHLDARPPGLPAIIGLEINPPETGWPPTIDRIMWNDLGIIESRDDRARAVELLRSSDNEPNPLVIVCDLCTTPDRGIGHGLQALAEAVHQSPLLVLSAGQQLRNRGYDADGVARRIADWRDLAKRVGLDAENVIELDLDHLTAAAAARLAHHVKGDSDKSNAPTPVRKIESAFALIHEHAGRWLDRSSTPSEADQLAVHRAIAELYRHECGSFRSLMSLKPHSPRELLSEIQAGATRFVDLLPNRLRRSPKWLAAGALAGAFGCVASSALISPIAIAALPSWSAIGAAIAAAIQPAGKDQEAAAAPDPPDVADAVRASSLFAVTLELQSRDETTITRVLEQTFADDDVELTRASAIHNWLNACRHRFDVALEARA